MSAFRSPLARVLVVLMARARAPRVRVAETESPAEAGAMMAVVHPAERRAARPRVADLAARVVRADLKVVRQALRALTAPFRAVEVEMAAPVETLGVVVDTRMDREETVVRVATRRRLPLAV